MEPMAQMLIGILWLTTLVALLVTATAWRESHQPRVKLLIALLGCIGLSSFCHGMGLNARSLAEKLMWNHAEYAGCVWIGGLFLLLALTHTQLRHRLPMPALVCLVAFPAFALAANWSNAWHHLYYRSFSTEYWRDFAFLRKHPGPLYWVFQAYSTGSTALAAALFLLRARQALPFYRVLNAVLAVAVLSPLLLNLLYLLHIIPINDSSMIYLSLLFSCLLIWWMAGHGRMLEIQPIARSLVLERMEEAVLVLDPANRLIDYNLKAGEWFAGLGGLLGEPVPADLVPGLAACGSSSPEPPTARVGGRWIQVRQTPLESRRGKILGSLCLCLDVTGGREAEAALQKAYREQAVLLRQAMKDVARIQNDEQCRIGRDLHDTLCQDLAGLSRTVREMADDRPGATVEALRADLAQVAGRLARVTHSARGFAHDLEMMEPDHLPLCEVMQNLADHAQAWHGIRVEANCAPDLRFDAPESTGHVLRIVREAIANAATHGKAGQAWVDILRHGGRITVSVSNNGTPLPAEDQLVPGMGLRGIRMRTTLLGGRISLRNTGDGTVLLQLVVEEEAPPVESGTAENGKDRRC